MVQNYRETCHKRFKYSRLFRDNIEETAVSLNTSDGKDGSNAAVNHIENPVTADL